MQQTYRTPFTKNTSGWLLVITRIFLKKELGFILFFQLYFTKSLLKSKFYKVFLDWILVGGGKMKSHTHSQARKICLAFSRVDMVNVSQNSLPNQS